MDATPPRGSGMLTLALLAGCSSMHIPPPADLGPPLPPAAVHAGGLDVGLGGQFLFYMPAAMHLRGAKAIALGDGPMALELGGNAGTGWAGLSPALHWAPRPRAGSAWYFGSRLGLTAGSGDQLGYNPLADPYLGASLLGQASWTWGTAGALTAALGWGYTGHTRCMLGCSYEVPSAEPDDLTDSQVHSYIPYNAPSLHLRADLPAGDGYAFMIAMGAQPLLDAGDVLPIFSLSLGLHHHDPGPRW